MFHNNHGTRRSTAAARSSASGGLEGGGVGSPAASSASDGSSFRPSASTFWLLLHGLCCLISLFLGFRFSRLIFVLLFSNTIYTYTTTTTTTITSTRTETLTVSFPLTHTPPIETAVKPNNSAIELSDKMSNQGSSHSQVVVGRHGIRIRPWPHPDPTEVMRAHRIIERVQQEQRKWYGVKSPRPLIVITPTYARTFQALHLTGLIHCLRNVPYPVTWIVVEAGGVTNETASLLARSRVQFLHIPFHEKMPVEWAERHLTENRMRLHGLRVIRERNMDGIVLFADDSNVHSLDLFDEIQKVQWMGSVSVGILAHSGGPDRTLLTEDEKLNPPIPVQGPACNSSGHLIGWHTFNSIPYSEKSATFVGESATVLPGKMEWSGFVFNARMIWKEAEEGRPEWVKDLDKIGENGEEIESPLALVNDASFVEPLGDCGKKVMLWWMRVEARADSKFPPGWIIDPPLEIVVPSKRTPWQETDDLAGSKLEQDDRRFTRPKSRSSSKRKNTLPGQDN
ncbi:hypothetical protein LUZ61_002652 [Rhynchospora tenuis]|uniref:Glycosyltransferases n=1 Tax=Rhynchospora tenuis TaxID=198213 RepID=A0AAD5ZJA2_9POAL|nr:hypothetical protein LUZ61_002652 [Rhynchospora tenuis]